MSNLAIAPFLAHTAFVTCAIAFYLAGRWRKSWWLLFMAPLVLGGSLLILCEVGITAQTNIKASTIHPVQGHAYQGKLQDSYGLFSRGSPERSELRIYEDGEKLRPKNAPLSIIQELGTGAFRQDDETIYFSASDNSDPSSNGRKYTIRFKVFISPSAGIAAGLLAFGLSWWPLRRFARPKAQLLSFALQWIKAGYIESKSGLRPEIPRRHILTYLSVWAAIAVCGIVFVSHATYPTYEPKRSGSYPPLPRINYYLANRDQYDVLFFGDSQSHFAVHPLFLNEAVGMRGFNLTYPNTFIPLQYAILSELAPKIPKSTVVVLGVTFQNLKKRSDSTILPWYPVAPSAAFKMWSWGLRDPGLLSNLLYFNHATHFIAARSELRTTLAKLFQRPLAPATSSGQSPQSGNNENALISTEHVGDFWRDDSVANVNSISGVPLPSASQTSKSADGESYIKFYSQLPGVDSVQLVKDGEVTTAALISLVDGSSCYIDIEPQYSRRRQQIKQITEADARTMRPPELDPVKVKIFTSMLDELKNQGIHVVVNAIEESPTYYLHPLRTKQVRALIEQTIEPLAKARGYEFIRIDWDQFDVTDYFDLTHLNCKGAQKAAPLLADKLHPVIRR